MTVTRLSPAAITRYRTCPKSFLLTDIERVQRRGEASPIFAQGNAVHHALERFYGLPAEERQPENLERALRSVWPGVRSPGAFASKDEEATFGGAALEMLRSYGERFDLAVEPLAREQWISLRVAGLTVSGKIDRIDRRGDGLDIIDFKTGRRRLEREDLAEEPSVQVYVAGAEAEFQLPVERVRFIYLALDEEVSWELEREDVDELKRRLVETVKRIQSDEVFEAVPGDHCRFCPARLRCPDRQRVSLASLTPPLEGLPF